MYNSTETLALFDYELPHIYLLCILWFCILVKRNDMPLYTDLTRNNLYLCHDILGHCKLLLKRVFEVFNMLPCDGKYYYAIHVNFVVICLMVCQ